MAQEIETGVAMVAKAAPPVAVVSASAAGITLPELVQFTTLIYVALMIIHKCWHMWKEWRTGKTEPEIDERLL